MQRARRRVMSLGSVVSAGLTILGCDDHIAEIVQVRWKPCGLYECGSLELPQERHCEVENVKSISLRRRRAVSSSKQDVWLLPGGPGISGTQTLVTLMDVLHGELPDTNVYTLDAYGTGASGHLTCREQESRESPGGSAITSNEVGACLEALRPCFFHELQDYGFTGAARDLAAAIAATREMAKPVVLYGISAGTLWAQRLLVLDPTIVDAVVLESFVPPTFSSKSIDATAEGALERLLQLCLEADECARRLPNPFATVRSLWPALEAGHCAGLGQPMEEIQRRVFRLLSSYPWNSVIPAAMFRLERCNEADVSFLRAVFGAEDDAGASSRFSSVLFQLVTASELWDDPHRREEDYRTDMRAWTERSLLGRGAMGAVASETIAQWPRYDEPLDGIWPDVTMPMLIMHGELDPRIAPANTDEARAHYRAPDQGVLTFSYAPHHVVGATPARGGDCAARLLIDFVDQHSLPTDQGCLAELVPPDFDGVTWGHALLGVDSYWEGVPTGVSQYGSGAEPRSM